MQTHLFVQKSRAGAQAKNLLAGSQLVEAAGFAGTPMRSGDSLNPAWSPDGKFLVFNATTNRAVSVPVVVRDAWPTVQPCW